jgi:hypothetical protein
MPANVLLVLEAVAVSYPGFLGALRDLGAS